MGLLRRKNELDVVALLGRRTGSANIETQVHAAVRREGQFEVAGDGPGLAIDRGAGPGVVEFEQSV